MLTKDVVREYHKQRKPYVYVNSISQGTAKGCLESAKRAVWVKHNWGEFDNNGVATSNDGRYRLRVVPDEINILEDLFGDTYDFDVHGNTVPGGKRTLEAQRKAAIARIEREGIWGYILHKKCPECGAWEHVDSCYGFDGEVPEDVLVDAMYQAKGD